MVDKQDIERLETELKENAEFEAAIDWAISVGIPVSIRYRTVQMLYARYGQCENLDMVRKMVRSKTGLRDAERAVHERIIEKYPHWDYEVGSAIGGSIDFIGNVPHLAPCIIEVKDWSSWKQGATILLYQREHPEFEPLVLYFGKPHGKVSTIVRAMNAIGIFVGYVNDDGTVGLFENYIEPRDSEF